MKCCGHCFSDKHLSGVIRKVGRLCTCDFCGSTRVRCVEASELHKEFAGLLGLYEPVQYGVHFHPDMGKEAIDVGDTLPQTIQDDWGMDIFNWAKLDGPQQCRLMDA